MNIDADMLFSLLGRQLVELELLRRRVAELEAVLAAAQNPPAESNGSHPHEPAASEHA